MKRKIISVFLSFLVLTFIFTYPYSYLVIKLGVRVSIDTFEQIIFPTKRVKILSNNGFIVENEICIPYKSLYGRYVVDVNLKDKSIKPFETKEHLLNEFDIHISIYGSDNKLLFFDTPLIIQEKSREKYDSVILNEYILPKAGCYKFKINGVSKTEDDNKHKALYFTIFIADEIP